MTNLVTCPHCGTTHDPHGWHKCNEAKGMEPIGCQKCGEVLCICDLLDRRQRWWEALCARLGAGFAFDVCERDAERALAAYEERWNTPASSDSD
jgi:hypothetical protein